MDIKGQWLMFMSRTGQLGAMLVRIPEIWVFLLAFALSWIPKGFQPIPLVTNEVGDSAWFRGLINGFFLAWTVAFMSFVQRKEDRSVFDESTHTQYPYVTNKHWSMYLLAAAVLGFAVVLEDWIGGSVTWWWIGVCSFLQITPWFMGGSLQEQAKHIGPKLTGAIVLLTTIWFLVVG